MDDPPLLIITLLFFLLLSAFFSGSETAYFNLKTHRDDIPDNVRNLLSKPRKLLISLLTGNTIVNVVIASLSVMLVEQFVASEQFSSYRTLILSIEFIVVSALILIFGEIFPKMMAIRESLKFAKIVELPLRVVIFLLYPIAFIFHGITEWVIRVFSIKKEKIFDSEEELKILTEVSEEQGTLQSEESEMIQSIFEFRDKTVHEIMTPRVDMVALSSNASLVDVMDIIKEKQFSKIPIYRDKIDNIKGILYAKDILPYLVGSRPHINLITIARVPYFVPETKELDELLDDFKERKTNVAIVVDEWGGTSGLITLEDVVEEVIGEIRDPFDIEDNPFKQTPDGSIIVDGSVSIYDLEEEIDIEFPEYRDYDTLGGFIYLMHGDIPVVDTQIQYMNRIFIVKQLDGNRISKVMIGPDVLEASKDKK